MKRRSFLGFLLAVPAALPTAAKALSSMPATDGAITSATGVIGDLHVGSLSIGESLETPTRFTIIADEFTIAKPGDPEGIFTIEKRDGDYFIAIRNEMIDDGTITALKMRPGYIRSDSGVL